MKQTNISQAMIQKQCLDITISNYKNERWTTKDGVLTSERYQNQRSEFIEEWGDA